MTVAAQTKYYDPMQDAIIKEFQTDIIGFSQIEGKNAANRNMPVSQDQYRAIIHNDIEIKTQSQIDANHQLHTPLSGIFVAKKLESESKAHIHNLQASVTEDQQTLRKLQEQQKKYAPDLNKRRLRFWVYIALAIISVAEGWFAYESLRASAVPKIPAFFTAISIAVAIGFGSHFLATYIVNAKTKLQRVIRYCFVLIPAASGFYYLGNLRAESYNNVVNLNSQVTMATVNLGDVVSNWSITVISFLLFLTALLFSINVHKSNDENNIDQEYDRLNKEIKKCQNKIRVSKEAIATIQIETAVNVASALGRYEYAIAVENRLQSIAKEALTTFSTTNLRYRNDGVCPHFYAFPPAFHFRLFFNNVKNNQHENATPKYVS